MIPNKERLGIEVAIRPHIKTIDVINSELEKVNGSIERKWRQLDDFSSAWSFSVWSNWKDSMNGELATEALDSPVMKYISFYPSFM